MDVGLMVFSGAMEPTVAEEYARLLSIAKKADDLGIGAIWLPERHLTRFGAPYPNPLMMLSALAGCTSRIRLRAGSAVAPLHDPVALAENLSVLDNLSQGRAGVAFASGWHPNDFIYRPENYRSRHDILFENVATVLDLWRGGTLARPNGVGEECEVRLSPSPFSRNSIPVYVTAAGSPETFERAGRIGTGILTHVLGGDTAKLASFIKRYRTAFREAGHDPAESRVVVMLHTYLAPTQEKADAHAAGPFREYLKSIAPLGKNLAEARSRSIDLDQLTESQLERFADMQYKRLTQGKALIGTAGKAAQTAREFAELGVDEIACLVDFGIAGQRVEGQLEYIAELATELQ